MPRGIPKNGFRKTKNWHKRNQKAAGPKPEQVQQPAEPVMEKPAHVPEKTTEPIQQKQRRRRRAKTDTHSDESTSSSITASKVGKLIQAKLDERYDGCCITEKAPSEMVGNCEFCAGEHKPMNVLIITSQRKPKVTVRMCRRCLSVCAGARLDM